MKREFIPHCAPSTTAFFPMQIVGGPVLAQGSVIESNAEGVR